MRGDQELGNAHNARSFRGTNSGSGQRLLDEDALARLGIKQVLKVRFNLWLLSSSPNEKLITSSSDDSDFTRSLGSVALFWPHGRQHWRRDMMYYPENESRLSDSRLSLFQQAFRK